MLLALLPFPAIHPAVRRSTDPAALCAADLESRMQPFLSSLLKCINLRQPRFSIRTFAVVSANLVIFGRWGPRITERGSGLVVIVQD